MSASADRRGGLPPEKNFAIEIPLGYSPRELPYEPKIAVICHVFFPELAPEIASYSANIPFPADLYLSTDDPAKAEAILGAFSGWRKGRGEIRITPNRGRDIAPKLIGFADVYDRYDYVLHLHSKASTHTPGLSVWRGYLFETLIGSPEIVKCIFELFDQQPGVGFIAPQHFEPIRKYIGWGKNYEMAQALAQKMNFAIHPDEGWDFPSGSMFWARSAALRPLLDMKLSFASFPEEAGQRDSTIAHAIERLFFAAGRKAGFSALHVARREFFFRADTIIPAHSREEVDAIIRSRKVPLPPTPDLLRTIEARGARNDQNG